MASCMDQLPPSCRPRDEPEFNLKEWALKARISRENTKSRRFSSSNITSFREEARSFRSNATISSTVSSPGYTLKDDIDPSTYSFTSALKALQARPGYRYGWEYLSPDGFALNSKWSEAEKYICNPLSGEFPKECLSAKTLSRRSIPNLTSRFTVSGPLVYSNHARLAPSKPTKTQENENEFPNPGKNMSTIDVGTQSTPPDLSSSSPSPTSTPSIKERSLKPSKIEGEESSNSSLKPKSEEDQMEVNESMGDADEETQKKEERKEKENHECARSGCLLWKNLWRRRRQRGIHPKNVGREK